MRITRLDFIETTAFMERKRTIDKVNEIIETVNNAPIYTDDFYDKDEIDDMIRNDVKRYDISDKMTLSGDGFTIDTNFIDGDIVVIDIRTSNNAPIISGAFVPPKTNGNGYLITVKSFFGTSQSGNQNKDRNLIYVKNNLGCVYTPNEHSITYGGTITLSTTYFNNISVENSKIYLYRVV